MNRRWPTHLLVATLLAATLPGAAGPAGQRPRPGARYALLVGVRQYDKVELRNLDYTENDVTVLAKMLRAAGYRRVVLMTQTHGAAQARYLPTAANIRRELRGLLEDRRPEDTVIVAFCGHGLQFKGSDEPYFCPMDTRVSDKRTLISLSEVYGELNKCKAGVKLLISDACRNDPLPKGARAARLGEQVFSPRQPNRQRPPENVVALFSCSAGETAYESEDIKHGVFFYYLIQGLRGKAALAGEKAVTLGALTDYVQRRVADHVKEEFGAEIRQRPELVGRYSGTVTLAAVGGAAQQTSVRARELVNRGSKLMAGREYGQAVQALNEAVRANGQSGLAHALRSSALRNLGQFDKALADAEQAVRLAPRASYSYFARGTDYLARQKYPRAIADLSEAIRLRPGDAVAYNNRGLAHARLKKYEQALNDYTEAIRRDPKLAVAYHNRGLAYAQRKGYDQALADYTEAIRLDPRNAGPYFDRGCAHSECNDPDQALADYTEAIRLNPRHSAAYNNRGLVYARRKEYESALADYNEATRINPRSAVPYHNRGCVYSRRGEPDKAIPEFNEAIKLNPRYTAAFLNRGLAHARRKDHDRAIEDFAAAIRLDPRDPLPYSHRGWAYFNKKDYRTAVADFSAAIRLDPKEPNFYLARARAHDRAGNKARAQADRKKARELKANPVLPRPKKAPAKARPSVV